MEERKMFRENIFEFVKEKKATLFIPKNKGLNIYVRGLLPEIGVKPEKDIEKIARDEAGFSSLIQAAPEDKKYPSCSLEIDLVRGEDIPQLVEDFTEKGETVYGLTGDDLFDEYLMKKAWNNERSNLIALNTYDWFDEAAMYKRPALCLMSRSGNISDLPKEPKIAVNKKYELISNNFIDKVLYALVKLPYIKAYNGGTEGTVTDGINDCCIDIVYSGKSLKENDLKVAEIVRFSDIVLIGQDQNGFGNAFCEDYRQVIGRKSNPKEGSLTTKLLSDRKERRNKLGVEMMELFSAVESGKNIAGEIADVVYAINLVMAAEGMNPWEVAGEVYKSLK